jgi:hypothetical protein
MTSIERTDGIPLFVEEMTKAVLEAGSESAAERTIAASKHTNSSEFGSFDAVARDGVKACKRQSVRAFAGGPAQ